MLLQPLSLVIFNQAAPYRSSTYVPLFLLSAPRVSRPPRQHRSPTPSLQAGAYKYREILSMQ